MVADRNAFHVNNGHSETDGLILIAPIPVFICAVLAIVLGTAGIRERTSGRTWAIVGVTVGNYRRRLNSARHARQSGAGLPAPTDSVSAAGAFGLRP